MAWGDDWSEQINAGAVAVAAGPYHTLVLKADGSIEAWGCAGYYDDYGQCDVPAPNTGFTAIAAGEYHSLAIRQMGACCDLFSGSCAEDVAERACSGTHRAWTEGVPCVDVDCEAAIGACCDHDPFGGCTDGVTRADCDCSTCEWFKVQACPEVNCDPETIPTVSEWGFIVLSLLLLIGAKLAFQRANAPD